MKNDEMQQIVEAYLAAYNAFDVDGMTALLVPDVIFRNLSDGKLTHEAIGLPAFRALAEQGTAMFSERRQDLIELAFKTSGGALELAATISFRGVLAAGVETGALPGNVLKLTGRSTFSFRQGKIASITDIS